METVLPSKFGPATTSSENLTVYIYILLSKTTSNVTDINETLLRLNNFVDEKKEENYNRVQIYLDTMRRKLERVQI